MKVIKQDVATDIKIYIGRKYGYVALEQKGNNEHDLIYIERTKIKELIEILKELEK